MPANAKANSTADRELIISRELNAPRELVWEAMTNPGHVVHWWGPNGFSTKIKTMDFRPGGIWQHVMTGPDGTEYPNKSIFKEIVKPEKIVYTHGGGEKGGKGHSFTATWSFEELPPKKTRLTIHMIFPTREDRDMVVKNYNAQKGGEETLARLDQYLPGAPVIVERTYNVSVEKVWTALTNPAEMKKWYFDLPGFKAEVGYEFEFTAGKDNMQYRHLCRITEAVPDKKLAYSWRYDGYPGDSFVTFELFAEGGKTRLKLTHIKLETFGKKNPDLGKENFLAGWTGILGTSLSVYLNA